MNGTKAGGAALTMASNGMYKSNRWGFVGTEDLGGGYYVRFNLEEGYVLSTGANSSTTNQMFQRNSTIGVGGAFGRVDIGHQFTLQHRLIKEFEPFDLDYLSVTEAAAIAGGTSGRDDNAIYYHGDFGPWTARADYAPGGVPGSLASGVAFRRKGAGCFRRNGARERRLFRGSNGDQESLFLPPFASADLLLSGIGRGTR